MSHEHCSYGVTILHTYLSTFIDLKFFMTVLCHFLSVTSLIFYIYTVYSRIHVCTTLCAYPDFLYFVYLCTAVCRPVLLCLSSRFRIFSIFLYIVTTCTYFTEMIFIDVEIWFFDSIVFCFLLVKDE